MDKTINFDSFGEFLTYADGGNDKRQSHARQDGREHFSGATWDETLTMAREGWREGVSTMEAAVSGIKASFIQEQVTYCMDVTGQAFDVGAYLTGEPECWLSPEPAKEKRFFRIYYNPGTHGETAQHQITNKGAALVTLVDALQADPDNVVEVFITNPCRGILGRHSVEVNISLGTSPLDVDSLAFVCSHPAFLRCLIFRAREIALDKTYLDTYGHSTDRMKNGVNEGGEIYIASGYALDPETFDTMDSTAAWLRHLLKQLKKD